MLNSMAQDIKLSLGETEAESMQILVNAYQSTTKNKETITFLPIPGFVIKTRILQSSEYPKDSKLFINVCQSDMMPVPLIGEKEIENATKGDNATLQKIPVSLSKIRLDVDRAGHQCFAVDVCINPILLDLKSSAKLRVLVLELALIWVQDAYKLVLSKGKELFIKT